MSLHHHTHPYLLSHEPHTLSKLLHHPTSCIYAVERLTHAPMSQSVNTLPERFDVLLALPAMFKQTDTHPLEYHTLLLSYLSLHFSNTLSLC